MQKEKSKEEQCISRELICNKTPETRAHLQSTLLQGLLHCLTPSHWGPGKATSSSEPHTQPPVMAHPSNPDAHEAASEQVRGT